MATETPVDIGTLITRKPGIQGGQPCVGGTRIRVQTIAILSMEGMTPEHIAEEFPEIDLARVHAALAYYHANKAALDSHIAEEGDLYDNLIAKEPPFAPPSKHSRQ